MRGTGALVISVMLDFLTFALCAPYSETTDGSYFDNLLEMVAAEGRIVFRLFQVILWVIRRYWSGKRPITITRMFELRHNILSNVSTNHRKYVVTWLEHSREVKGGTRTTLSGA